jgi:hypothetical protein
MGLPGSNSTSITATANPPLYFAYNIISVVIFKFLKKIWGFWT